MKKITLFSIAVLILCALNLFAYTITYVNKGGSKLGVLTEPIKLFSNFPKTVIDVIKESFYSEIFVQVDPEFEEIHRLSYDLFSLNASFTGDREWLISLKNLKTDSVLHEWTLSEKFFNYTDRNFSRCEPISPILLRDGSVISTFNLSNNLYRVDSQSKLLWHNTDFLFHHALNPDAQGNVWVCGEEIVQHFVNSNGSVIKYKDNSIIQVDFKSGETIYHKSISEILFDNDMGYLIHGMENGNLFGGNDPLHLNDIEPVLSDGQYWNKGDLFLSFRNRSMIIQYRPETNRVLRVIQGPFYNQHDVDIVSDSTISIFNNNSSSLIASSNRIDNSLTDSRTIEKSSLHSHSEVLIYNLSDSLFSNYCENKFKEERIFTLTEGLHHILDNGDMLVEEQNNGKIFLFNENELLLKKYYNNSVEDFVQRPHWVRIYENLSFLNTEI